MFTQNFTKLNAVVHQNFIVFTKIGDDAGNNTALATTGSNKLSTLMRENETSDRGRVDGVENVTGR